jgi:predicted Zn-dependent peptidase
VATRPTIADADVGRVRALRLDRLRQLRNHPPAAAERVFARALYGAHPYGRTGLGDEATLGALTAEDVRAFHGRVFVPARATLVLAGDAGIDELVAAAEQAFGGWQSSAPGADPAAAQAAPSPGAPRLTLVARAGAAQSELRLGHTTVSRATPDYHALLLLNAVLGGQFVSRLNLNLRQDKGYTYGARTGFDLRLGPGYFAAQASVQSDATAAAATEMLREIAEIRDNRPPTDEELSLARASLTLGYPRAFETAQQVARGVASLSLHGLPDTYFADFVPTVRATTREAVERAAAVHLEPGRLVGVAVGDIDTMGPAMSALGLGDAVTAAELHPETR